MKNFVLSLLTIFSCNLVSQTIDKQLQSNLWYGKGWLQKEGVQLKSKTFDKSDLQIKFYPNGKMFYTTVVTEHSFSADGYELLAGDKYTDSSYVYKIKNNIIKIHSKRKRSKSKDFYYLKMQALPENESYELISVPESDFK